MKGIQQNSTSGKKTQELISVPIHKLIAIKISRDGYSGSVVIKKHVPDVAIVSSDIMDFLRKNSIVYGLKMMSVAEVIRAIKSGPDGKEIVVATGKPLEEGVDGIADYKFRIKLKAGTGDEQRMNFKERGLVNNVRAGQILARITPAVPGKPGMRVDGQVIEPKSVLDVVVPDAGINVSRFEQGNIFVFSSMAAGHARLVFDEMQVNPDFIVTGDLDLTKGNIDFVKNVGIRGTVKSGFTIKAGGDVVVDGDVESDAVIEADGDITIRKTINCGKKAGKIIAGGTITANRIINSTVQAYGDVFVKDQILESNVWCQGKFATSWGKIVGCEIEAIEGLVVNFVGLPDSNGQNILHVGESIITQKKLEKINKELERIKNELALLSKQISSGKNTGYQDGDFDKLDINEQERIKRTGLARSKHAKMLNEENELLSKERKLLLPKLKHNSDAVIEIKGGVYPSCEICIRDKEIRVLDEMHPPGILEGNPEVSVEVSDESEKEKAEDT